MEDQPPSGGGGNHILGKGAKSAVARLARLDDLQQVAQRLRQAVVFGDDDYPARS